MFNNQLFQLSYPVFWKQRHPNNNSTNSGKEDDKNNNNIKHRQQRQQQLQLHLLHQAPRHSSAPVLPWHDPSPSVPHFPQVPQLLSSSQVITSPLHSPPLSKVPPYFTNSSTPRLTRAFETGNLCIVTLLPFLLVLNFTCGLSSVEQLSGVFVLR